jgi:pilus assembly protein CpaB
MRTGALLRIGLALALGTASVFVVRGTSNGAPAAPAGQAAIRGVVVARTTLAFGSRIGAEHLEVVPWPEGAVPPGSFTDIAQILDGKGDRVALRTIDKYEPVLAGRISQPGGRATLSTIVDRDMRAMTIRVDDVLGVAGFVLPGDRVDILLTRAPGRPEAATDVLLQNVRVLGVDQEANDKKDKPVVARAVTLEVSPADAQKLTLAANVGLLGLSLRNQADATAAETRTIHLADITPAAARPAAPAPRHAGGGGEAITVLRGMKAETVHLTGWKAPPP